MAASNNGHSDAVVRGVIQAAAGEIAKILERIPQIHWKAIAEESGIAAVVVKTSKSESTTEKILQDADETDIEMLGRLSMEAMKRGLKARTPNAQVLRVFKDWQREQAGLKQIEAGVVINIVPAEVPDEMSPMLVSMMKELRDLATASNL